MTAARLDAVIAEGARDVEAVGRRCGAGAGCGGCRPEIRRRLRRARRWGWLGRLLGG